MCIVHVAITYGLAVKTLGGMSPIRFLKGIAPAGIFAFSSASSAGTLLITMKNTTEDLGVNKGTSSFVLPLGATINMDGTATHRRPYRYAEREIIKAAVIKRQQQVPPFLEHGFGRGLFLYFGISLT
ncbi:hypothetical protein CR205_03475 [Alteribacter lacisalsi]|uniref:Dicarboxylate/amino acid:cation symporter n=1 Tax=Alteribacter lacisalsi TaxID=2045244 RepID=A0A2W0HA54_9BACI|nr:cation:dicarboxylase symporter family transporter [Alteribacter lacisalsi]PYZ97666.1 hypothetical protein CR205_03475 [Alteribacter lacisalsi]